MILDKNSSKVRKEKNIDVSIKKGLVENRMVFRSILRDVVFLYIAYRLLSSGVFNNAISNNELILFGLAMLIFSLWFLLEKLGILPRLG